MIDIHIDFNKHGNLTGSKTYENIHPDSIEIENGMILFSHVNYDEPYISKYHIVLSDIEKMTVKEAAL